MPYAQYSGQKGIRPVGYYPNYSNDPHNSNYYNDSNNSNNNNDSTNSNNPHNPQ